MIAVMPNETLLNIKTMGINFIYLIATYTFMVRSQKQEKIEKILAYIRVNALDKERMKIENLADKFLMSASYISIFVKKHSGLSIQNHIIQYKIKLAEKLLMQSNLNIGEISFKMGFNDASHFNKFLKKHYGKSPLQFRSTFE